MVGGVTKRDVRACDRALEHADGQVDGRVTRRCVRACDREAERAVGRKRMHAGPTEMANEATAAVLRRHIVAHWFRCRVIQLALLR